MSSEPRFRAVAVREGVRLETITVVWMAVEAALAIGAGVAARSVLLTAFGADSVIELISGAVLLWRLKADGGDSAVPSVERAATAISAALLVLLCAYVALTSVAGLALGIVPQPSAVGVAVAAVALVAMPLLAWRKRAVNEVLRSAALRADIAESTTCAYLAAVTLAGVAVNGLTGFWWAEYLGAILLLRWLVPEAREAFEALRGAAHDHGDD